MTALKEGSAGHVDRALDFAADTSDPKAGRMAISRELASEQPQHRR